MLFFSLILYKSHNKLKLSHLLNGYLDPERSSFANITNVVPIVLASNAFRVSKIHPIYYIWTHCSICNIRSLLPT